MSFREKTPPLLLAGLIILLWVAAVVWVSIDRRPPQWDHANHLERAVHCRGILTGPSGGKRGTRAEGVGPGREMAIDRLSKIIEMSSFYPPLVPCAAGILYLFAPVTPLTSQIVMLIFLTGALVSLYLLGKLLFDPATGLLAALIFGTAPFVVFSTTNFQLDLPLAAVVIATTLALAASNGFEGRGPSWAAGALSALGLLTKPPFVVYLLPALGLAAWKMYRSEDRRGRLVNFGVAIAIPIALALPWYGPRLFGLPMQVLNRSFKQAAESGYPDALTASSLLFYPRMFPYQFGLLAGLLFLLGVWALRSKREARGILLASFFVPFALFLFIQNKNLRYTLPLLPVAALIASVGLRRMPTPWRRPVTAICVAVSLLQVGMAAFGVPPVPRWPASHLPLVMSDPPNGARWPHGRILSLIVERAGGRQATVSVVPNDNYFSVSNFRYYAARDRLSLRFTRAWEESPFGVEFAILKTGSQGPEFSMRKPKLIMDRIAAGDLPFEKVFPVIGEFPLPDGSRGILRQRRLAPVEGVSARGLAGRFEAAVERFLSPYAREIEGLKIKVAYDPAAILEGRVSRVEVEAERAEAGELSRNRPTLRLSQLRLAVEDLLFNPHRLVAEGVIEPLDAGRLVIKHLVISEEDLQAFLARQKHLRGLTLRLEDGAASVVLRQYGPDVAGRLALFSAAPERGLFSLVVERLALGWVPLPGVLVNWVFRHYDPAPKLARLPLAVEIGTIRVSPGQIEIGDLDGSARGLDAKP